MAQKLGENNPVTARVREKLGELYLKTGDLDKADVYFDNARASWDEYYRRFGDGRLYLRVPAD